MKTITTHKRKKSERLNWEVYSDKKFIKLKTIIGSGIKVKKSTYCSPVVEYNALVP